LVVSRRRPAGPPKYWISFERILDLRGFVPKLG
jgi:hypothetical protein